MLICIIISQFSGDVIKFILGLIYSLINYYLFFSFQVYQLI